jgi:hypothetical protein
MQLKPKLHLLQNSPDAVLYAFHCPVCGYAHWVRVKGLSPLWTWNGSLDKPTFSPSILVNKDMENSRCHSFVKDWRIQFLNDCHHELKNQTVEIPDWDD